MATFRVSRQFVCPYESRHIEIQIVGYGNFDIIFNHFSRTSQLQPTPRCPYTMVFLLSMLIGS